MKTFKNGNFTKRDYECTNIVACVATAAPKDGQNWIEADESALFGLNILYSQAGVRYYGWL